MQKIKRLAAMLAGALMFVMAAGCGETGEEQDEGGGQAPAHTHTFAGQWSQDPQYHWHAATCMHVEEVSDKAAHVFEDGKCSVCGYRKTDEDIDPFAIVSDKLTEAEWKAALAKERFLHNVKIFGKSTLYEEERTITWLFWENAARGRVTAGELSREVLMIWDSERGEGDLYYLYVPESTEGRWVHDTCRFEPGGYPFEDSENPVSIVWTANFGERFAEATYNEEMHCYMLADGDETCCLKFQNGRLCAFGFATAAQAPSAMFSVYYGTLTEADFAPPDDYEEKWK